MNKTIFITGASAGLGKATARLFAAKGWNVIATMRKPENETELNRLANVSVLPLDVTNVAQIKDTTQQALAYGPVDVVFNNAGYSLVGALEAITDEQLVRQMDINFLGVVRVTQAFIPSFRAQKSGLFITTSSITGLMAFPMTSMYAASKWALEGWSESLSFELSQFGIVVKNIEPGVVATTMADRSVIVPHPAYDAFAGKFFSAMSNSTSVVSSPEQIAQVVYEAATDGADTLRYVCGEDAKAMYAQRLEAGDEAFRQRIRRMIITH